MANTTTTKSRIRALQLTIDACNNEIEEIKASDRSDAVKAAMIKSVDATRYAAWVQLTALETGKRPAEFV